jgi:predicted DNA-binding transcriptional regulator AlpA
MPDPLDLNVIADAVAARVAELLRVNAERLIDLDELAARIGVSRRGASGLVARGELPSGYLIGGVRRWNWRELERWLSARQGRQRRHGRGRRDRNGKKAPATDVG